LPRDVTTVIEQDYTYTIIPTSYRRSYGFPGGPSTFKDLV